MDSFLHVTLITFEYMLYTVTAMASFMALIVTTMKMIVMARRRRM